MSVSISLSSGFSFQVKWLALLPCPRVCQVSISLSSGFSFQGGVKETATVFPTGVSISLSSGFSFQATPPLTSSVGMSVFQSRYRAASHFRRCPPWVQCCPLWVRFNLVIERLLISGGKRAVENDSSLRFNLVIERLLISGCKFDRDSNRTTSSVSISLSSGFSFQDNHTCNFCSIPVSKFQSRYRAASHFR